MNRILILLVLVLAISSCKKYEDDNTVISFRKPETRLVKRWHASYVVENGEDVSSKYNSYYYTFSADKRVSLHYIENINNEDITSVIYGNWRFTHDDSRLEINFDNFYTDYEILELTSKKLSLRSENLLANRMMFLEATD